MPDQEDGRNRPIEVKQYNNQRHAAKPQPYQVQAHQVAAVSNIPAATKSNSRIRKSIPSRDAPENGVTVGNYRRKKQDMAVPTE